jgi:hypothetical protein
MKEHNREYFNFAMKMLSEWTSFHNDFIKKLHEEADIAELADMAYSISQIMRMFDEIEKKTRNTYELAERLLCMLWAQQGDSDPIRTSHCTITPRIRMAAQIPKKGTPEYEELMSSLGIDTALQATDAVRPHWPGLVDYVTELLTNGRPLPRGVDPNKTYPVYGVTIRPKKGITE